MAFYEYGRVSGMSTGMSIRRKAKMSMIKMAVKIAIICVFMFVLMPYWIAPDVLGLDAQTYEEYKFVLGILAGMAAAPFLWFSDRLIEYQMGR